MELIQEGNRTGTIHEILNGNHRLEYISSTKTTSYYKTKDIIVKVYDWGEVNPINLVREEFVIAMEGELGDSIMTLERYLSTTKLPILQLCILNRNSKVVPLLMNLWEYKVIVLQEEDVDSALSSAYIKTSHYPLTILVEDPGKKPEVTSRDMDIIEKTLDKMEEELLKLTNKTFIEIETYG